MPLRRDNARRRLGLLRSLAPRAQQLAGQAVLVFYDDLLLGAQMMLDTRNLVMQGYAVARIAGRGDVQHLVVELAKRAGALRDARLVATEPRTLHDDRARLERLKTLHLLCTWFAQRV